MKLTKEQIARKVELYNALMNAISECELFAQNIAQEARDEFDEMSERAQEGTRGTALDEFADAWESFDAATDVADAFDELPTAPN